MSAGLATKVSTGCSSAPSTRSNPMRAKRTFASDSWPGGVTSTIGVCGRMTSPAYSAKRPPNPTLTEPRKCPAAKAMSSRASSTTAPSCWWARTWLIVRLGTLMSSARRSRKLAVAVGGEREVQRRDRLTLGDGFDEVVLAHRRERIVGAALLADRRHGLGRQVLAARRAGTVSREHLGGIRQREQALVEGVVELAGQFLGGDTDRGQQVGAADVADEQRVAGQHPVRRGVVTVRVDDDADRLRRVPGVSRISSSTSPNRIRSPSPNVSIGNSARPAAASP